MERDAIRLLRIAVICIFNVVRFLWTYAKNI